MLTTNHHGVYIEYTNGFDSRSEVRIDDTQTFLVNYEHDIHEKISADDSAQEGREVLLAIYAACKKEQEDLAS